MEMFCYQCEQTAFGKGCTKQGVCGKSPETANAQDELINSLIELANSGEKNETNTKLLIDGLFATITNVNFDTESISKLTQKVRENINVDKKFDINNLWHAQNKTIQSLKSLILFGIKGMAAYAHHAKVLGYENQEINDFFYHALQTVSNENSADELLKTVLETGRINLKCMELLDKANTETYGNPIPTKVSTNIEPKPFIVVSGHDLKDLALLLEQTKDKGINIYTHGEMLPAHAYPELKKYEHLKGNFGTAWQNQQKEFLDIPAPILFTTNCIMPPKDNYADRIFTTSIVEFPEIIHIGEDKDFSPLIEKALELGGYKELHKMTGINGGEILTTGFGHHTVLSHADDILSAMNEGKLKHIFLIGGCDGARPGRNYYTKFAELTPKDSLILTLACGKYRFNDLNLGEINGFPRIIDMGQCNDAYSAIRTVFELAKALNCDINDLPISYILSWYEQKAVCVLLTLLSLEIKNIHLGPSLPAFIAPEVLNILVDKFNIKLITTPEQDLKDCLE